MRLVRITYRMCVFASEWAATRARLDTKELERQLGPITVPTPAPKEQPSSN